MIEQEKAKRFDSFVSWLNKELHDIEKLVDLKTPHIMALANEYVARVYELKLAAITIEQEEIVNHASAIIVKLKNPVRKASK